MITINAQALIYFKNITNQPNILTKNPTGSRPSGWGGCQPNSILPAHHNLYKLCALPHRTSLEYFVFKLLPQLTTDRYILNVHYTDEH